MYLKVDCICNTVTFFFLSNIMILINLFCLQKQALQSNKHHSNNKYYFMLFETTSHLRISAIGVLPNVAKLSNTVYPFLLSSRSFRIVKKVSVYFTLMFVPFIELYLFGFNVTCNRKVYVGELSSLSFVLCDLFTSDM